MALAKKRRRLVPVRLGDVPFERRIAAARREARYCADDGMRSEILASAFFPSPKVYWIYVDDEQELAAA